MAPYQIFAAESMRAANDKTGVPGPTIFVMRLRQVDIQIDPLPLRRHFELPVSADVLEVGTNKHLGEVPIPELVRFRRSTGRGFKIQFFVRTDKQEVQILFCPARADFRAIAL